MAINGTAVYNAYVINFGDASSRRNSPEHSQENEKDSNPVERDGMAKPCQLLVNSGSMTNVSLQYEVECSPYLQKSFETILE